ncbi:MAG: T9SS type A sorting domain-containing protein, partial [Bacteroidia bacterium]|nr:T9SS type A sorting domain-containing protein [Bacteroidia bacterium]
AQYNDVNFGGSGVTITNYPSGSDGTDQGDIILYENVALVSGESVDCYVVVDSVTSGGLSTADQNDTTGSGYSSNKERFFSPFLNLSSSGGTAVFSFQFISDGSFSYNSTSNTYSATNVTIDSVLVNSYDLDGNGSTNSNQFTEFGGFATSELSLTTNLTFSTSNTTGLTKWVSTKTANTTVVTAPENRIRVFYDTMSSFQIAVGHGTTGWAYYFLEFAAGNTFHNTVTYYKVKGNILSDANGVHGNNTIDGTPISKAGTTQLYSNLVNSGDSIVESVAIDTDGSYAFNVVVAGTYNVMLSSTQLAVNSTGNYPSLPSDWVFVGENLGTSSGHDGNADGKITVTVTAMNIEDANFGINKAPQSDDKYFFLATSPVINEVRTLVSIHGMGSLTGNDFEDGAYGAGGSFIVEDTTGLNGNTLFYDANSDGNLNGGEELYSGDTVMVYVISKLAIKFTGEGSFDSKFNYAWIDAAGTSDPTPATFTSAWTSPVPVEFIEISARLITYSDAQVNWSTAMELNNSHFEVQRMDEMTGEFITVGEVNGAGTTNEIQYYNFIDDLSLTNDEKLVYRIKQVDFDGQFDYSEIASISRRQEPAVRIFPIPANNDITISIEGRYTIEQDEEGKYNSAKVDMVAMDGRIIESVTVQRGSNAVFNTTDLNTGIYFITVNMNGEVSTRKFLVKH